VSAHHIDRRLVCSTDVVWRRGSLTKEQREDRNADARMEDRSLLRVIQNRPARATRPSSNCTCRCGHLVLLQPAEPGRQGNRSGGEGAGEEDAATPKVRLQQSLRQPRKHAEHPEHAPGQ
jgi:hypothetical protein